MDENEFQELLLEFNAWREDRGWSHESYVDELRAVAKDCPALDDERKFLDYDYLIQMIRDGSYNAQAAEFFKKHQLSPEDSARLLNESIAPQFEQRARELNCSPPLIG